MNILKAIVGCLEWPHTNSHFTLSDKSSSNLINGTPTHTLTDVFVIYFGAECMFWVSPWVLLLGNHERPLEEKPIHRWMSKRSFSLHLFNQTWMSDVVFFTVLCSLTRWCSSHVQVFNITTFPFNMFPCSIQHHCHSGRCTLWSMASCHVCFTSSNFLLLHLYSFVFQATNTGSPQKGNSEWRISFHVHSRAFLLRMYYRLQLP